MARLSAFNRLFRHKLKRYFFTGLLIVVPLWALLGLACVGQGFGWVTISTFLPRVPMSRAGLLLLLQPTFAALWAALFFGRHLTLPALVGAVLALAGVYGGSVPGYGPSASDRDRGAA